MVCLGFEPGTNNPLSYGDPLRFGQVVPAKVKPFHGTANSVIFGMVKIIVGYHCIVFNALH